MPIRGGYRNYLVISISSLLILILIALPMLSPLLDRILHPLNGSFGSLRIAFLEGYIEIDGLNGEVNVLYDGLGIPHIYASNYIDAYKVMGFLHAKDRFFQMDVMRRLAQGRLSELFGELTLDIDRDFRHLGLYISAEKTLDYIANSNEFSWEYQALLAYTEGVNQFLRYLEVNGISLTEYSLLGLKPEPWKPVDSISIGKFMAWSLSWSMEDLNLQELVNRNGLEILVDLDLLDRSLNTPILDKFKVDTDVDIDAPRSRESPERIPVDGVIDILEGLDEVRQIFGMVYASNNWVVSGDLTRDGYPIVANDPHLTLTAPPIWYYIVISFSDGFNILGASLPGTPVIVLGRNNYVAWGFTNVGPDVTDYYYFLWDGDKYLYKGVWRELDRRVESIRVWDGNEYSVVEYIVNDTVIGPLYEYDGVRYAMRWTGSQVTLEFVAVMRYNYAEDIYGLIDAAKYFHVAPQNLVAADIYGNILYYPAGLYPVRNASYLGEVRGRNLFNLGYLPFNASNGEGEWIGYIEFNNIPHVINPDEGFVVTANNKVVGDYPFYLGWSWADRYRYVRIKNLLLEKAGSLTLDDMMSIQVNLKSYAAESIIPYALDIIRGRDFSGIYLDAFELMDRWDFILTPDSKAAPLYIQWLYNIHRGLWGDVLGDLPIRLIPLETTEDVIKRFLDGSLGSYEAWVGDVGDIIYKAFLNAVDELEGRYGDIENWRWGDILKYRITHFMGDVLPWLNYRVYDGQGGLYTVFPAGFSPGEPPYEISSSQSMRSIYVLDGESISIYFALPGGNIGIVFSPHYEDLLDDFVAYRYFRLEAYESLDESPSRYRLVFRGG